MKIITELEFFQHYKPIKNHINEHGDAPWNNHAFEKTNAELQFIRDSPENTVWTLVECDNDNYMVRSGRRFVNASLHFITSVPWTEDTQFISE